MCVCVCVCVGGGGGGGGGWVMSQMNLCYKRPFPVTLVSTSTCNGVAINAIMIVVSLSDSLCKV